MRRCLSALLRATLIDERQAERLKPGLDELLISALIRLAPVSTGPAGCFLGVGRKQQAEVA